MNIPVIVNDKEITFNAKPDDSLADVLRSYGFKSVKCGCRRGLCGSCTVLLEEKPVCACRKPIASVRGQHVTTMEGFMSTQIYADITKGFEQAGIHLCGFCNAGKYFAAYEILNSGSRPTQESITEYTNSFTCECTENSKVISGILTAATLHRKHSSGSDNAN